MARKIEVELVGDSRSLERAFGRAQGKAGSLGGSISKLGKIAAAGAAILGTAMVAGSIKAVQAASNLEEQINKTKVVFRGSEKAILSWSKTTANSFGISQRAALEAAGTFGNMLVPMGVARKEAGKMSTTFVELAADMASFNNASPEETLDALRAGLAGETEPLRRFGVFLNEARIQQEAVNLGIAKSTDKLTAQQKAMATYSIILKDTKDAQGDFARTSDSLANMQRKVKAQVEDLAAAFGKQLLPAVSQVVGKFSDFLTRLSKASGLKAKVKITFLGVEGMAKDLFSQIQDALFGRRELLKLKSGKVLEWEQTDGLVKELAAALRNVDWRMVGQVIGAGISEKVRITAEFLNNALDQMTAWVDAHQGELADIGAKLILGVINKLTDPEFWAKNWQLVLGVALLAFPTGRFGKLGLKGAKAFVGPFIKFLPEGFRAAAAPVMKIIGRLLEFIGTRLSVVLGKIPGWIRAAFRVSIIASFISTARSLFDRLREKVVNVIGRIKELWNSVPAVIRGWISPIFSVINRIQDLIDKVRDLIGWISRIHFPSPPGWLSSAGNALLPGNPFGGDALGGIVKRGGIRRIHTGEQILPARVARGGQGNGNGGGGGYQLALVAIGPDLARELQQVNTRYARGNGGRSMW